MDEKLRSPLCIRLRTHSGFRHPCWETLAAESAVSVEAIHKPESNMALGVFGLASVSDLQAGVSTGSCSLSQLLFLFLPQYCLGQCNWGRAQWICPWLLVDLEMAFVGSHSLIQSVVSSSSALCFSFLLLYEETEALTGYMLLLLSCPVMSDSLWPHGLQHARPPCPSPSLGVCPSSCSLHQWCLPAI